jgi:hypothetical protein
MKNKIDELIEKIDETNGASKEELGSKLVKATQNLVSELGSGVEFHLSLNPPSYAKETGGSLEINYKKIQEVVNKEIGESKAEELPEKIEENNNK